MSRQQSNSNRPEADPGVIRERVHRFLAEHLPSDWEGMGALSGIERARFAEKWREALHEHGFLGMSWPTEYGGGGLTAFEESIAQAEFVRAGVPVMPARTDGFGITLIGPLLIARGTDEQRREFLPKILSGEHRWAQGFSEPEAGSDLFGLRTRARMEGDEWVIDGQKVWQTSAWAANWMFTLVRTDPTASTSSALSFLLIPLEQPGVEVRPIPLITGEPEFCEVFLTGARTGAGNIVGEPGEGASVALSLLGFERGTATGATYASLRIELDRVIDLARRQARTEDPLLRQRIAYCHAKVEAIGAMAESVIEGLREGRVPGSESSLLKLTTSEFRAELTDLAMDVLGPAGLIREGDTEVPSISAAPLGTPGTAADWQNSYLGARAALIYGGTNEIQRTTIGERLLGLEREPRSEARR